MMVGKYPIALIHIEMDPSLLDVNVHPQKYEVKFVNESILSYHIEMYVKETLNQASHQIPETIKNIRKVEYEQFTQETLKFGEQLLSEVNENQHTLEPKLPELEYVGVFSGTYLLFQNEEGLYLMDQHAAAERIRYEHYFRSLANPNPAVKHLLFPKDLEITKEDKEVIKTYQHIFESYGFIFDIHLELLGIPVWLLDSEVDLAVEGMVSMLVEKGEINLSILRDRLAKDISCKGAIKANKSLNQLEIDALLINLRGCENPYTCPHGRPTLIKLTNYDIERMFKRVV
jgi:DNA mismatch repair protein MutL